MASTHLSKSASGGSRTTWTISTWVKRSGLGTASIFNGIIDTSNESQLLFNNDSIEFYDWTSGLRTGTLKTNAKYRDTSAWYHIVAVWDTTNATAGNRMRLYVNGVEETSFATDTQPSSSQNSSLGNGTYTQQVGLYSNVSGYYFDGLMSHFHFIDGTAYDASYFGETDATTGIWKPIIEPSVTYGTNGFFLKFNEGALGTDSSPNGNNFTVNGSLTPAKDTPENVFATLNPLDASAMAGEDNTFSNGNLSVIDGAGSYIVAQSTLATSKGKYYWEVKINATTSSSVSGVGICDFDNFTKTTGAGNTAYGWIYTPDGSKRNNSTASSYGNSYTTNDIIGIALDMDNGYLYFSKNGVWQNSGDPTSGASGTGSAYGSISGTIGAHAYDGSSGEAHEFSFNFGNGYFGTTPVSSATSDESGLGIFEYTVPSGYYALCTKNINEQEYD